MGTESTREQTPRVVEREDRRWLTLRVPEALPVWPHLCTQPVHVKHHEYPSLRR